MSAATATAPGRATILVATDKHADAALVKQHLEDEFGKVAISTDAGAAARDFERHRPGVLVLAFDTLEKAERYYLGLYRLCPTIQSQPHRTVMLCNKDEVKQVYEMCKRRQFDDYVVFWPMTYDMSRLAMAVHHALRELGATGDPAAPSTSEFAAQARRLGELEGLLDTRLAEGGRHVAAASRAMAQAEQDVGAALDGWSQQMVDGALPHAVTVKNADALRLEVDRLKREDVGPGLRMAAQSTAPLQAWADGLRHDCAPHLETARALNALAGRVQPTVLVVDDDEFQRDIIAHILAPQGLRLLFAGSGIEAFSQMRQTRPDLVLMDVQLPDMDGVEVTRRLKALPQFAAIPVIMITGKSDRNIVAESLKAGVSGFVVKPFERETLIARVRQVLKLA